MARRTVIMADATENMTIQEAFEEFLAEKVVSGIAPKTRRNYEQSFQYFMELELDEDTEFPIGELYKTYILQWVDAMTKRKMKVVTMNSYLRVMRAFLYWCMDTERQYISPPYKLSLIKGEDTLPRVMSEDDVEKLLQKPVKVKDFVEWRTWAICNWVVATGNRATTVCGIKIGDIDFKNKEISLRHLKSKKAQIVPLSHALENIIKTYIRVCRSKVGADAWLFPNESEGQLTYNALSKSFARYCEERGAELKNIHSLRHYFATAYARETGDAPRLQKLLGHSTITMTMRYMSLVDEDLRKDFDLRNPLDKMTVKRSRTKKVEL